MGAVLLVAWVVNAADKTQRGVALELLWSCHVFALALWIGVLARWSALAEVGAFYFLSAALPGYFLDVIASRTTAPASLVVHLVAAGVGFAQVRRGGLHRRTFGVTLALCALLIALSRALTPPSLNINLAFGPHPDLVRYYGAHPWLSFVTSYGLLVGLLAGGWRLLRRTIARELTAGGRAADR